MVTDLVPKYKDSSFATRIRTRAAEIHSWLCVGLDPDPGRFPEGVARDVDGLRRFCVPILERTVQAAACVKINVAFFEQFGSTGWAVLEEIRALIPPEVPVMLDAKRGDIGNTAAAYARALFDVLGADAVTLSPYLGWDSLDPFLTYDRRGVFVLCRTSNPGSRDLQTLEVDGEPLYRRIAREAVALNVPADIGLVVGATQPDALRAVRRLDEDVLLLAPGVGAQGATAHEAITAGGNRLGDNVLASVSREILYASSSAETWALSAGEAARRFAAETWTAREAAAASNR